MTDKTDISKEREALQAYLKDCEAEGVIPAVGTAWHAAFQAGRASLQSPGFSAEDMATASAQGFRDGAASLAAAEAIPKALPTGWSLADHGDEISLEGPGGERWRYRASSGTGTDSDFIYRFLRASLSANAGEPRKVFLVATGDEHEGEATYTRYDDKPPPLCDSECLFATPPTAQAEGWIASKDQMPPPGVRVFWGDADSNRVGYDSWAGEDFIWTPSHWMPIPPFKAHPTSAEGVGHG